MHLILCSFNLLPTPLQKGEANTRCFVSQEDYTVGPWAEWPDAHRFRAARAAWWGGIGALDLPRGGKREHHDWLRVLPRVRRNDPASDLTPDRQTFLSLIASARRIGLWHHDDLQGRVWLWQVLADLARTGVDPARVETCRFGPEGGAKPSKAFGQAMLTEAPDLPERPAALPRPPDADLLADPQTCADFALLAARIVDPATGLSGLRWRLLRTATVDLRPMARTVGEALVIGLASGDCVGDIVLQAEARALTRLPEPLIEIEGAGEMGQCRLRLTMAGERVRDVYAASE